MNINLYTQSPLYRNSKNSFDNYLKIKDTLYTKANYIIEVYIPEQTIYLHSRGGKVYEFLCSTGNPRLEKGVSTPEGIFLIQNKARKVYSRQFDSTLMLNWMGFNLNIGFHALLGRSYYRHLGERVSSHGCIRISREASEFFYKNLDIGTPVIIHSGNSARIIAFTNDSQKYIEPDKKSLIKITKENLKMLYGGLYLNKRQKVLINTKNLGHSGLEIGDEKLIPPQLPQKQLVKSYQVNRRLFEVFEK